MENILFEKLQLIAIRNNKTENLDCNMPIAGAMYWDKDNQEIGFNNIVDRQKALSIVQEICDVLRECGYVPRFAGEQQLTQIMAKYIVKYQ